MTKTPYLLLALCTLLALGACRSTKYVGEGQYLLSSVTIELDSTARADNLRPLLLMPYVGQKTNTKLFGTFNWGLGIYNLSKRESNSWLSRRLRAWGEPPVIYSQQEADYGRSSLESALYNMGYLDAVVTRRVDTVGRQKLRNVYSLNLGHRHRISHHEVQISDTLLRRLISPLDTLRQKRDFPGEVYRSYLDSGAYLAPDAMQAERKRITQILRNRGHWGFREEYIRFEVDTTGRYEDTWVRTRIDTTSRPFRIGKVNFSHGVPEGERHNAEHSQYGGIHFYSIGAQGLSPTLLDSRVWLRPGRLFSQDMLSRTYSALSDIPAIQSTTISLSVDSTATQPTLDLDISTQPERSKELSADIVGTHTGGNLGAMASLAFGHNNLFGGAEQFRISGNIGYEDLGSARSDHLGYGFETSLRLPKLILPFWSTSKQRPLKGATDITLSYNYLTRPEFRRNMLSASWGYSWVPYRHPAFRYVFKLLEADYMHFGYMDESFLSSVPDYDRMLNYRNQIVLGTSMMVSYNSLADYRLASSPFQHNIRLYLQLAGNLLMAYSRLTGVKRDDYGAYALSGANIVQFFKGELDYSGLYRLGGKNALAYHAALSAVVPYGNSTFLPIDLRYFSGGASSLRGWSARGLGPGSMSRSIGSSIFHQVGDIKLDLSAELRLRVLPSWELALFADAGNIWTIRRYAIQPGGDFSFDRFYRELALSSGLGLRWDFDYFLLRLDAGLKLYDPQVDAGQRWVIGRQSLGDLLGLHFAIGYPF